MELDLSTGNPYSRTGDQFALELKKYRAADDINDDILRTAILNRKLTKVGYTLGAAATIACAGVTLEAGDVDPEIPILYTIDGIMYTANSGNATFTDTSVQPKNSTRLYLISVTTAGTFAITNGLILPDGQGPEGPYVPPLPEGHAPMAVIKIVTGDATFTPATTNLNASGVTATAYDLSVAIRQLPAA